MKTDALIAMLATGPVAADPYTTERRIATAIALGIVISVAAMFVFLGPRRDLEGAAALPMFWVKVVVPILLAGAFGAASLRLARPGGRPSRGWTAAVVVLVALWALALFDLAQVPAGQRAAMAQGASAWFCVASIAMLSLPLMVALFIAIKGLAPTRLTDVGLSAGALAGSLAAAIYAVHCNETALPFLAVWYVLGIGLPAAAGAAIGRKLLRWT